MKGRKKYFLQLLWAAIWLLPFTAQGQLSVYTFEQIDSLQKVAPRNAVVFIHTDWCNFCQSMKNTTFKNTDLTKVLNQSFWFADLNAEEERDINFHHQTFKFKPTGRNTGVHELAEQLGTKEGKLSYPAICVLNEEYEIVFQYDQYLSADQLLTALQVILDREQ